jgi:ABC-2 type transport system ATP-binding protein
MLGPNGAGKSTTIGILGTLVRPTAGRATVAGFDVAANAKDVRRNIGFAMQEVGLDELATGSEFLILRRVCTGFRGVKPHGALASCSAWSTSNRRRSSA